MQSKIIRQKFINFFKQNEHKHIQSAPIVPESDKTLLFTNAGMVPFKNIFLGKDKSDANKIVSIQKCVRAGGKHNDLENVGYTKRHHTFFEMMGNFSFGDYFKQKAITMAWEFLTKELGIDENRLYISVFKDDQESYDIWHDLIKIPKEKISYCDEKDNFWSMGAVGPCGPCTEIFFDNGEHLKGGPPGSLDQDGDRYVEIWNIVFMQYERLEDGTLQNLPNPCVDTGMGLERICAVLQGKDDNFESDLFAPIITKAASILNIDNFDLPGLKVIADHVRLACFLIMENILPSNEGRGYVLRRVIRRALRYGYFLNQNKEEAFLYKLVNKTIENMSYAHAELALKEDLIKEIIQEEEVQFLKTLTQGLKLISKEHLSEISGEFAFKLYDTYGFPLDILIDYAKEKDIKIDLDGFNNEMQKQKERSKSGSKFNDSNYEATISFKQSEFKGYESTSENSQIIQIIKDGKETNSVNESENVIIVLSKTVFYPEGGGQIGDSGFITSDTGTIKVIDTQKKKDTILHYGIVERGFLDVNQKCFALIDKDKRELIAKNHTATHLLHSSLKKVLGESVNQKGSLVNENKLRFDFTYNEKIDKNKIAIIENIVNQEIWLNTNLEENEQSLDEAIKEGATALFEDKYKDKVRVIKIGGFSKELCGGTHVKNTSSIGVFKITNVESVSKGIKRIEAITNIKVYKYYNDLEHKIESICTKLNTDKNDILDKLDKLLEISQKYALHQKDAKQNEKKYLIQDLKKSFIKTSKVDILITQVESQSIKSMKEISDELIFSNAVIILASKEADKVQAIARYGDDALKHNIVDSREVIKKICGVGGGRPNMAQGGGIIKGELSAILNEIKAIFTNI
jgi:alanyl-tRNA synthetase